MYTINILKLDTETELSTRCSTLTLIVPFLKYTVRFYSGIGRSLFLQCTKHMAYAIRFQYISNFIWSFYSEFDTKAQLSFRTRKLCARCLCQAAIRSNRIYFDQWEVLQTKYHDISTSLCIHFCFTVSSDTRAYV